MRIRLRHGDPTRAARWFSPPRLRTGDDEDDERHATWLELFFDLVFVVAVTELSHELVLDHSVHGFLVFAGLFVPVYVAWQGYSFYADRFDTDDVAFRLALFAGMLAIAALAVQIGDVADGSRSAGFALSYIALRSLMLLLYLRAWVAVAEARPLIRIYGGGYAVGVCIWALSLAFAPPTRYVLWGVALALDLSLPPLSTRLHRRIPTSGSHVRERWALFTLIVLGESVVAVAIETAGADWDVDAVLAATLGFGAVAGVWWLYFDRLASVSLRGTAAAVVAYSYAHLPLLLGLAALSAGLRLAIEGAAEEELGEGASVALLGGVAVFLLSLVATRVSALRGPHRVGVSLKLGATALIVGLLAAQSSIPPVALVAALTTVLVALVVLERTLVPPSAPAP